MDMEGIKLGTYDGKILGLIIGDVVGLFGKNIKISVALA